MTAARTLKTVRLLHLYSGVLFAPTILFFAITGGLQMFGLHETARESPYKPPAFLVHMAQLHKKGTLYLPPRRPAPAKQEAPKSETPKTEAPKAAQPPAPVHSALATKIFFATTAVALVVSTLTGLTMAWKYTRRKSYILITLLVGVLTPALLLLL